MDEHSEETQKLKGALTEQTRSLEVLDRNMQNVSREITAIVGKIEEDSTSRRARSRIIFDTDMFTITVGWRPSLLGWRPLLVTQKNSFLLSSNLMSLV